MRLFRYRSGDRALALDSQARSRAGAERQTPACNAGAVAPDYFLIMACCGVVTLDGAGEIENVSHAFQPSARCAALNSL